MNTVKIITLIFLLLLCFIFSQCSGEDERQGAYSNYFEFDDSDTALNTGVHDTAYADDDDNNDNDSADDDDASPDCHDVLKKRLMVAEDSNISKPILFSLDIETGEAEQALQCLWPEPNSESGCFSPCLNATVNRVVMVREFDKYYKLSIISLKDQSLLDVGEVKKPSGSDIDWGLMPQFTRDGRSIIWREPFSEGGENEFAFKIVPDTALREPETVTTATWLSAPFSIQYNKAGYIAPEINSNYARIIFNARINFVDIPIGKSKRLELAVWELNHLIATAANNGKEIFYLAQMDTTGCPEHFYEGMGEELPMCDLWLDRRNPPDILCEYELRAYNIDTGVRRTIYEWCADKNGVFSTPPPKFDMCAGFSVAPDDSMIAYSSSSTPGGRSEIYLISLETGELTGPVNSTGSYSCPSWYLWENERVCESADENL